MAKINISKIVSNMGIDTQKVSKSAQKTVEAQTREMELVPKVLELAKLPKGEYRFSPEDIKVLTEAFQGYDTALGKYDLAKELLAIGQTKGKHLSTKEISSFLKATDSFEPEEQEKVLKFIKTIKESEVELEKKFSDYAKNNLEIPKEKDVNYRYLSYACSEEEYYKLQKIKDKLDITKIIGVPGYNYAEKIGKCSDPETLANIVIKLGPRDFQKIRFMEDSLIDIYKLGDGNMALIKDLTTGFYVAEIKAIVKALKENPTKAKELLKQYESLMVDKNLDGKRFVDDVSRCRKKILKHLNLKDKIKTYEIEGYQDVFGIGSNKLNGNFEGGKHR